MGNSLRCCPYHTYDTAQETYHTYDILIRATRGGPDAPTALIRLDYLLRLSAGQAVPCRQDLPKDAIFVGTINDDILILAMSYCWCTQNHPDPEGKVLAEICEFGTYLDESREFDTHMNTEADKVCVHKRTIVVFWDYASLYQNKPNTPRTPSQERSFQAGLASVNVWYAHPKTWVLLCTEAHRPLQYMDSAWPYFEWSVSQLTKPADLSIDVPMALEWIRRTRAQSQIDRSVFFMRQACRRRSRQLALVPRDFNTQLEKKTITKGGEKEVLEKKYKEVYDAVVKPTRDISLKDVPCIDSRAWDTFLATTLPMCKDLRSVDLSYNDTIESGLEPFADLRGLEVLKISVCVGFSGSLLPLSGLSRLDRLEAYGCLQLSGGLEPLARTALRHLDIEACSSLQGTVQPLASLHGLKELCAGATHLEGLQAFAEQRPSVQVRTASTGRPQRVAAYNGQKHALQSLFERRADVNHPDERGATPLLLAATQGHSEAVRVLLDMRADVGRANDQGMAPLWAAARKGFCEIVCLLLGASADVGQANHRGATPLIVAEQDGHSEVVKALRNFGARR